ncbi:hypothetical protein [Burkholderia vietnamiensis]|uniref:hypothetical protein n=1 Tax=Burkholderia vietnamiensis TaxID=60552 RepID=UPI001CF2AEF9|nr:hypothetical protein [Burkholderia vietnamiensis]MCA8228303.1 hypothetical protein [Burkholderia vietnamiensis]
MPEFRDFVEQLKAVGVIIEGEFILATRAASTASWTTVVADAAVVGRNDGIRFTRVAAGRPTNEELREIVQGYLFTPDQQNAVIDNVMYVR